MTKQYVEKVRKSEIGMRPVLPLALPMDLGYVGTIDESGGFNHRGTIGSMLGLNTLGGELPTQQSDMKVSITSGKSVQVGFNADAKTDGPLAQFANLRGKASISFGAENGFFAAVNGLKIRQLAEPQLLIRAVLNAYDQGRWGKDWAFVFRVGIAQRFTAILASEADTVVLLKASGKVAAAASSAVDVAAGFKFAASTKAVTQITGGKDTVAFYDAYRVKDTWFSGPKVERYSFRDMAFGVDLEDYPSGVSAGLADADSAFSRA